MMGSMERLHDGMIELQSRLELVPGPDALLASSQRPALLLYQGRIVGPNLAMEQLLGEGLAQMRGGDPATRLIERGEAGGRRVGGRGAEGTESWCTGGRRGEGRSRTQMAAAHEGEDSDRAVAAFIDVGRELEVVG